MDQYHFRLESFLLVSEPALPSTDCLCSSLPPEASAAGDGNRVPIQGKVRGWFSCTAGRLLETAKPQCPQVPGSPSLEYAEGGAR